MEVRHELPGMVYPGGWRPDVDTGAYPIISEYVPGEEHAGATRPLAAHPAGAAVLPGRIDRLRLDRWILVFGWLAAAIVIVAAFAAAGSDTSGPSVTPRTAVTHAATPARAPMPSH